MLLSKSIRRQKQSVQAEKSWNNNVALPNQTDTFCFQWISWIISDCHNDTRNIVTAILHITAAGMDAVIFSET